MSAMRIGGSRGLSNELLNAGDVVLVSDAASTNTTTVGTTLSAASMLTGNLFRSGTTAGFTDVLDTASNMLLGLQGNGYGAAIVPGLGVKLRITNLVAQIQTITLGTGMTAGSGTVSSIAASSWRDFLFSFTSVQTPVSIIGNTTSGSAVVTWTLSANQVALGEGPASSNIVQPGAYVTGTGIAASTTVLGTTQGVGGTTGVTLSGTATATGANVSLSFGPAITVHSSGSGTD